MTPHRDLSSTVPFGRSLRASRERRAAADRRRRRVLRGRAGALLTGLALTGLGGVAAAQDGIVAGGASPTTPGGEAASTTAPTVDVRALQRRLGVPVDGVMGSRTRRAIKRFQRRHGLVPDGVVGPRTRRALGLPAVRRATRPAAAAPAAETTAAPSPTLTRIARCESGGDPAAVSADGRYRGKYQFDRATWRTLGGSGDPAAAPEAEQDARAADLLAREGTSPWPSCAA